MKRVLFFLSSLLSLLSAVAQVSTVTLSFRNSTELAAFTVTTYQTNLQAIVLDSSNTRYGSAWWKFHPGSTETVNNFNCLASTGVAGRWIKQTISDTEIHLSTGYTNGLVFRGGNPVGFGPDSRLINYSAGGRAWPAIVDANGDIAAFPGTLNDGHILTLTNVAANAGTFRGRIGLDVGTPGAVGTNVLTMATPSPAITTSIGTTTATSPWGFASRADAEATLQLIQQLRDALEASGILVDGTESALTFFRQYPQTFNGTNAVPVADFHIPVKSLTITAGREDDSANSGSVYVYLYDTLHSTLTDGQTVTIYPTHLDNVTWKADNALDGMTVAATFYESGWTEDALVNTASRASVVVAASSGDDIGLAAGPNTAVEYFGYTRNLLAGRSGMLRGIRMYYRNTLPATAAVTFKCWKPVWSDMDANGVPLTWDFVWESEDVRALLTTPGAQTITLVTPMPIAEYCALSMRVEYDGANYGYISYASTIASYTNVYTLDTDPGGDGYDWIAETHLDGKNIGWQLQIDATDAAYFGDSRETGSTTPWGTWGVQPPTGTNWAHQTSYWLTTLSGARWANGANTSRSMNSTTKSLGDWDAYWSNSPPKLVVLDLGVIDMVAEVATNDFRTGLINYLEAITNRGQTYPRVALIEQLGWVGETTTRSNLIFGYNAVMSNIVALDWQDRLLYVPTLSVCATNGNPCSQFSTLMLAGSGVHMNAAGHEVHASNIWNYVQPWLLSGKKLF